MRFLCHLILLSAFAVAPAHAVVSWGGDYEANVVAELPAVEDFQSPSGQFTNLAVAAQQVRLLFFIPVWNYDKRYAFVPKGGDGGMYECTLSEDEINHMLGLMGKDPVSKSMGFWNQIGGKLLALIVLPFLFIAAAAMKDRFRGGDKQTSASDSDQSASQPGAGGDEAPTRPA